MFSRHVTKQISAYCHGELSAEESRNFSEHIFGCPKCRFEFEEIKKGIGLAQQISLLKAPDNLWDQMAPLLESSSNRSVSQRKTFVFLKPVLAMAAVLLLILGLGIYRLSRTTKEPAIKRDSGWNVERLDGRPKIGASSLDGKGQLPVGQWLETDANSKAEIEVSSIGRVQIDPNTRVKIVETQPTQHRLELAHGKMSAQIWAPPRLFFVDTPSAVAADLGCAYTLEVDDTGRGLLRVTTGWVALELRDRESTVPAGAVCQTRPGVGPGTPYFEDASPQFQKALELIDFGPPTISSADLRSLLSMSRRRDSLTLWHLLSRVHDTDRVRVFDQIAKFFPPPAGVTREGILNLNKQMLDSWRQELEPSFHDKTLSPNPIAEAYWKFKNAVTRHFKNIGNH